jgi:putative transposase
MTDAAPGDREAEVEAFLAAHAELEDAHGRRRVVRNGHASQREIEAGIGPLPVRRPKLRARGDGSGSESIRFTSKVLSLFLRTDQDCRGAVVPPRPGGPSWLYQKGVSFGQVAAALLGPDVPCLA